MEFQAIQRTWSPEQLPSAGCDWMEVLEGPSASSPCCSEERPSAAAEFLDSMLCVPGPKLIQSGFEEIPCKQDDVVFFVNAGGGQIEGRDSGTVIEGDSCYQGGDPIKTDEAITEGGGYPSLYQSARLGDFSYRFEGLAPREYLIDLHFAEIVNTNGPKGMRVFDVFVQEEKVLSEVDIYAVVGANRPMQLADIRASTVETGSITVKFVQVSGTPTLCGICVRKAPESSDAFPRPGNLFCSKCASEVDSSPSQRTARGLNFITKYEKKINELTNQCQLKTNECHEAWMLLTDANEQLEKLRTDLDTRNFENDSLDLTLREQNEKLNKVHQNYEKCKSFWLHTISNLEQKIKFLKAEQIQLSQDAHNCANSIPELSRMISAVQDLVAQCEDLKMKYSNEQAMRKKLYNQLQEAKGNIRIFCRCRPLSKKELAAGSSAIVDFEAANNGDIGLMVGSTKKIFKFDRVYAPKDDQAAVFRDACPVVTSVLDGYNVCIFAYGQTGTGKTFTMEGSEHDRGVNYRTLAELFRVANERKETFSYHISVSVLEVYNEQIRDLLATTPSSKKLEVRQASEGVHHVPGIVEANVANIKEVWDVLKAGSSARAVGSNNVNEHSSRSHCMLCIMVKAKNLMNGECTKSKLWLVDLAGSERLAKTDAHGERLKEAQNINRSLSALGDVISALASKSNHIPYRNSKLTHILQDSLGGDSKTLMFVQISPSENDLGETQSSLNFASRVRGIELGPAKRQVDTCELQKTRQMLDKNKQELRIKDDSLRRAEENYQYMENKFRGKDQLCKNLQAKVKELESELQTKSDQQEMVERQQLQLCEKMKNKEETCTVLEQKVKELEHNLREQRETTSTIYQNKVMELECSLRERQKREWMLEQKVKELETKVPLQSANAFRGGGTPPFSKGYDDSAKENEGWILRSGANKRQGQMTVVNNSSSSNSPSCSILLKGADSLQELKRRREVGNAGTAATTTTTFDLDFMVPNSSSSSSLETKISTGEAKRTKKIDSARVYGRFVKTTTSSSLWTTTGKVAATQSRFNREQPAGPRRGRR